MANRSAPNARLEYHDAMSESTRDDQPPSAESQSTRSREGQYSATLKASPSDPAVARPPKACETCRALKIGCIMDENSTSGACRRCVQSKRRCVRLPVIRRRRKRTDARVTDLEKKMEDLIVALEASKPQMSPLDVGSKTTIPETDRTELGIPLSIRDGSHEMQVIDLIDQGVMEAKNAYQLFEFYKEEMSGMFPFVVFSSEVRTEIVRHEKPLLFLSVITVAAGVLKPELHRYLTSEVWRILADRVIYTGAPSVEVIQALQIMALYYTHHTDRDNYRNFHHLVHSAAVMAMDAGMGKRIRPNQSRLFKDPWEHGLVREAPNSAEIRRTWLGAYHLCSTYVASNWCRYNAADFDKGRNYLEKTASAPMESIHERVS
jgi:Fungal specific transcription factor domain